MHADRDSSVVVAETWNLEDLYPDNDAFLRDREAVVARIPDLNRWTGQLGDSGAVLADALDAIDAVGRDLHRLHAYAMLRSDADARVPAHHAARQEIELVWNDYAKVTAFVRPEILEIGPERIEGYLAEERRLAPHAHNLRDLLRLRDHVLSRSEEKILAETGLVTGATPSLYNVFQNAELPRPEVRLSDGTEVRLTSANFARHRVTAHRGDREMLFREYFGAYDGFRETLGLNLYECVKTHMFQARVRNYPSSLHAALDGDHVPPAVYTNLIEQIHRHLPVLYRYLRLRARALGVDSLSYHDLHCPLVVDRGRAYSTADAGALVRRSMQPMGAEYAAALTECFGGRWIDWHPTPGKRSGAYSAGSVYDVHPYILLNFNGDYEGVSTLTHEIGHAVHSHFSNASQPYPTADYSIFVAEVASTFNEALLNRCMYDEAETDEERLFLVGTFLDQLRTTMFRQAMFAEFEARVHERAEAGEALTGEVFSGMYLDLLRAHHGVESGVVDVPDRFGIEWAAVPHFYYDFYVYQYATGIVASTALAETVLDGDTDARDRYLRFLRSGGSDYPLDLLRNAGVDLEAPEPYELTMRAMGRALDRLEELLGRLGR